MERPYEDYSEEKLNEILSDPGHRRYYEENVSRGDPAGLIPHSPITRARDELRIRRVKRDLLMLSALPAQEVLRVFETREQEFALLEKSGDSLLRKYERRDLALELDAHIHVLARQELERRGLI